MVRHHEGRAIRPQSLKWGSGESPLNKTRALALVGVFALAIVSSSASCGSTNVVVPAPSNDGDVDPNIPPEGEDGSVSVTCPTAGKPTAFGKLGSTELEETSGLAVSSLNPDVYWAHNDSGDVARAFAISKDGKLLTTMTFDSAEPRDIEDMAIEDDGEKSYLYFGDIGDNDVVRTSLTIHRVEEPKLDGKTTLTVTSEKMTVKYADKAHNAETLLFDPTTKDLLIATKLQGGPTAFHRIGPFKAGKTVTTEEIAKVDFDLATGGEISRDGSLIALRGYQKSASLWVRQPGESLADALARRPCTLPLGTEKQGETFAFFPDGKGYVTVSEGVSADLHVTMFE